MKSLNCCFLAPVALVLSSLCQLPARAADDIESEVLKVQRGPYLVEMLANSDTYSQAWAMNASGALIGQREVANADKTIFRAEYFFYDGNIHKTMPMLEGFSNVEAIAISDNNLVVGFASRAVGHPDGSLIAVVWEPAADRIAALPRLEGDVSSHAQDISGDGSRITGYSTGLERMRPVLWTKGSDQEWQVQVLPTPLEQNPYMMSSRVIISPDGKTIAACCTANLTASEVDSDLFLWREEGDEWKSKRVTESQMYLRDMNNAGQVVGSLSTTRGKRLPCIILTDSGEVKPIAMLPGDVTGEAWGINAEGMVVGFSDDPAGKEGGPQPFLWKDGKTSLIEFGPDTYGSAHSINDAGQIAGYVDEPVDANQAAGADEEEGRILAFRTMK